MTLTTEDLDAIRLVVREELSTAGEIARPDPATLLPVRAYTNEEVEQLRAVYEGLIRPQDYVAYRDVPGACAYIDSVLAYFGVRNVTQLPDSVQSGEMGLWVRYDVPFRNGGKAATEELPG